MHRFLGARELLDLCARICDLALDVGNTTSLTCHFVIFSALVKRSHGIVKATDVIDVVEKITKLCGDTVVISFGNDRVLRQINRTGKAVGIDAEQLLTDARGIAVAFSVGGKVIKGKAIPALLCAKKALDAVFARFGGKLKASPIRAALPRHIFFAFVFVKRLLTAGRHAVKHRLDKSGKGAFAPAVFLQEDVQSPIKGIIKALQLSKILDV